MVTRKASVPYPNNPPEQPVYANYNPSHESNLIPDAADIPPIPQPARRSPQPQNNATSSFDVVDNPWSDAPHRDLRSDRPLPAEVPDGVLAGALVRPPLAVRAGRVVDTRQAPDLPGPVAAAVRALAEELVADPFAAPPADRLAALGLGRRELAAAERAGAVLRVSEGVVLLPDAVDRAAAVLATLPQPFTTSAARQALGTSRRVAIPLLELLDRRRLTRRLTDDRRVVQRP